MRDDFFKVIVERPRLGSRGKISQRAVRRKFKDPRGFDDAPSFSGSKRNKTYSATKGEIKMLNENLSPMRRALKKFVGRKWDNVYSDFRKNLDVTSTVHKHVIDHLKEYVRTDVRMSAEKGGVPMVIERTYHGTRNWMPYESYSHSRPDYYVNPLTGILCVAPVMKRHKTQKNPTHFTKYAPDGNRFYWKHQSIWYVSMMKQLPLGMRWGSEAGGMQDFFLAKLRQDKSLLNQSHARRFNSNTMGVLAMTVANSYYGAVDVAAGWYCSDMHRQLNSRELKELGLTNK